MKDEQILQCGPAFAEGLIEGVRRPRPTLTVTIPNPLAQLVEQAKADPAVFGKNAEAIAQKLEQQQKQEQVAQRGEYAKERKKRPPLKKRS